MSATNFEESLRDILPLAEAYLKSTPLQPGNAKIETARALLRFGPEPQNMMFGEYEGPIHRLWAALKVGNDNNEVPCASLVGGRTLMPLIAADEPGLAVITSVAGELARLRAATIRIVEFTKRRYVETCQP